MLLEQKFVELIRNDTTLLWDSKKLKSVLLDISMNQDNAFVNSIVIAQDNGIVSMIESMPPETSVDVIIESMTGKLHERTGLKEDIARRAVECWVQVLVATGKIAAMSPQGLPGDAANRKDTAPAPVSPAKPGFKVDWVVASFIAVVAIVIVVAVISFIVAKQQSGGGAPGGDVAAEAPAPAPAPDAPAPAPEAAPAPNAPAPAPEAAPAAPAPDAAPAAAEPAHDAYYYVQQGDAWLDKGNYKKAITNYDEALKIDPNDPLAYNQRGLAYSELGNSEKAISDYTKAIKYKLSNIEVAYSNRGIEKNALGNYEGAISDCSKSINIKPTAEAYNGRGAAKSHLDDFDGAIEDYSRAIFLNSEVPLYYKNRGLAKGNDCDDFQKACNLGDCSEWNEHCN